MDDEKIFPVPENYKKNTHVTKEIYEELFQVKKCRLLWPYIKLIILIMLLS